MEVARFKCGRELPRPEYPDYGAYGDPSQSQSRFRRNALIEPLDKPACDSEWSETEVGNCKITCPSRREEGGSAGSVGAGSTAGRQSLGRRLH